MSETKKIIIDKDFKKNEAYKSICNSQYKKQK